MRQLERTYQENRSGYHQRTAQWGHNRDVTLLTFLLQDQGCRRAAAEEWQYGLRPQQRGV